MNYRLRPDRIARDKEYILNHQHKWPAHPILALKSTHLDFDDDAYCALMWSDFDANDVTVYIANIMDLTIAHGKTWADVRAAYPQRRYASLDDMLTEYMVD